MFSEKQDMIKETDKAIDGRKILSFGRSLFDRYRTEKEIRKNSPVAQMLQDDKSFCERVKARLLSEIESACREPGKREQKIAFRRVATCQIEGITRTLEYFKNKSTTDRQIIFSSLPDVKSGAAFEEIEKSYYFLTCSSKIVYHIFIAILKKFFADDGENDYKSILWQLYGLNHRLDYQSILARAKGKPFTSGRSFAFSAEIIANVKQAALRGEDIFYSREIGIHEFLNRDNAAVKKN